MERILVLDPKKRKKVVSGYYDNNIFLCKGVDPKTHLFRKYNGYCISQEILDILKEKGCAFVHFEIRNGELIQIIESEFEDWIINSKIVNEKHGRQKCLPLKYWRNPLNSERIDNKPHKTQRQIKEEKMATIDMHSSKETRFCRKCEEYTGKEPIMNCQPGRFWVGKTSVPTKRKVQFYFLGESPWKDEFIEGRYLVGKSGDELDDWIYEAGIDPKGVYVDNVARCAFPRTLGGFETQKRNKIRNNCSVYLFSELDRLKPEIIVPMGNTSLQTLLGVNSITRWAGRHILYHRLKCHLMPVFHPAGVLRQPWYRDEMIEHLKYAKSLIGKPYDFKEPQWIFVTDDRLFEKCIKELEKSNDFSVDLETIGLDCYAKEAQIIGIALSAHRNRGYFLPLWEMTKNVIEDKESVPRWNFEKPLWSKIQLKKINKLLADRKKLKVFHNAGFDANWLIYFGFDLRKPIYDTIIGNSVLDNIDNGLKELSWLHTDFGGYEDELYSIPGLNKKRFDLIDPFTLAKYGAYDGVATQRVKAAQDKMLIEHGAKDLLPSLMDLRYNLSKMELIGCRIDKKKSRELKIEYGREQEKIEKIIRKDLNIKDLNVNSSQQLIDALYGDDGLLREYNVKPSTDKKIFTDIQRRIAKKKKLTLKHQKQKRVIDNILEYRRLGKLITTYLDMFLEKHDEKQRIHTHFTVHVARTGRLSSRDPNLQNIARKGGIRDCFIADPGCVLVEFDYSQLELRIAAEYCQDEGMLAILNDSKGDIHSQVGVISIKQPNGQDYTISDFHGGELRAQAKVVSFSLIYGKTPMSLAFDLDCTVQEAGRIQRFLLEGFPKLGDWISYQQAHITKYGFVDNLFGRRYYIDGALSNKQEDIEAAFRKSVNYPVQGSASDVLVLALNRLDNRIEKEKWPVKLLLTVHDSLLFNVDKAFKKEFLPLVKAEMERPLPQIKHVKLFADCKVGYRWGTMKETKVGRIAA